MRLAQLMIAQPKDPRRWDGGVRGKFGVKASGFPPRGTGGHMMASNQAEHPNPKSPFLHHFWVGLGPK
jgi:hypothetical protein